MGAPTSRTTHALRLLIAASLLAACSSSSDEPEAVTSSTIPPAQTLLRIGVEQWPDCLNPLTCDSPALRQQILQHVLPVAFELDAASEYQPSPLLAEAPEVDVSSDGMRISYRIARDARWNDGRPITSSDFRATWQAIVSTPESNTAGYELITSIDDADPLVAVVNLSRPYADWRELFGGSQGWVLQGDALGPDLDLTDRFRDELPFSASRYRLAAWDDRGAVLAAVEDHWGAPEPAVDQVRLVRVDIDELEDPQAYDMLVPERPGDEAPDGFDIRRLPATSVLGIWFDRRTPLLDPLVHRQALASVVDRSELSASVGARDIPDCLGWLPTVGPWCDAAAVDLPETNRDLAGLALATAGWTPSPFGPLARGAEVFSVPLTHDPAVPGAARIAEAVAESLARLGVAVEQREVPRSRWLTARAEPTGIGVQVLDLGITPQVIRLYGCDGGPQGSPLFWCPADVVAATRALGAATDTETQLELVQRIGTAAGADVAWLPIAQLTETSYVQTGRVTVPDEVPAGAGALAMLGSFQMG